MPLRICVLHSSFEGSSSDLTAVDAHYDRSPAKYFSDNDDFIFEAAMIRKATSYTQIRDLVRSKKYDCFFNLCDGAREEDRAGEDVVRALEEFNVPFTGSDLKHYELSKTDMKMLAADVGIKIPNFVAIKHGMDIKASLELLQFPVIVKQVFGYSSVGITTDSKCYNVEQAIVQVNLLLEKDLNVLVEEFIEGEEVTVLTSEMSDHSIFVYEPLLMRFPTGVTFKYFELKWLGDMEFLPLPKDHVAYQEVMRISHLAFESVLGGIGYGRLDLRITPSGDVYFLEINSNPGIFYPPPVEGSADWILIRAGEGAFQNFIRSQISAAIARHASQQLCYEVAYHPSKGYHLIATRDIAKDEIVFHDEGRAFVLHTKPFVEKNWPQDQKDLFGAYAWPITSGRHVYVTWHKDPKLWRNINHSCDPNLLFGEDHSLNVLAIRPIARGEELTMDYVTFYDTSMTPFECFCGTAVCCGKITNDVEWLAKYGTRTMRK